MKLSIAVTLALLTAFLFGCSSIPDPYIPAQVGSLGTMDTERGLQVQIESAHDAERIGMPVTFSVHIRNTSNSAIWVPKDPALVFLWTYPNGRRDNHVMEIPTHRFYQRSEVTLLEPGEHMQLSKTIETYYFNKSGITEFQLMFKAPQNTNPKLEPFWDGKLLSNRYGVLMYEEKPENAGVNGSFLALNSMLD